MGIGLGLTEGELGTEQFPNCTNSCHQLKWPRRKTVFFGQTWRVELTKTWDSRIELEATVLCSWPKQGHILWVASVRTASRMMTMPASTSANRLLETSDASFHSCHSCFVTRHRRLLDVSGPMGCAATRKGRGEAYCDGGDEAGGNWCGRSGDHEGPMAWLGALVDRYGWTKISGRTSTKMHQVLLCGQPWIAFPQSMLKCRIHVELGRANANAPHRRLAKGQHERVLQDTNCLLHVTVLQLTYFNVTRMIHEHWNSTYFLTILEIFGDWMSICRGFRQGVANTWDDWDDSFQLAKIFGDGLKPQEKTVGGWRRRRGVRGSASLNSRKQLSRKWSGVFLFVIICDNGGHKHI